MNVKERAFSALSLKLYDQINKVDRIGTIDLDVPSERCYILRMLIKRPFMEYKLPNELEWCREIITTSEGFQEKMGLRQPFVYLTIRNGLVDSILDDEWHVDGFSQTITHLPEQNYIWTDVNPTEYVEKGFKFPDDFDHQKHNIHKFFQHRIDDNEKRVMEEKTLYCFDPYVVHRRPPITEPINRCFVRVSYVPIEIEDINNTLNPLLETNYKRDGVVSFRDKLIDYDVTNNS